MKEWIVVDSAGAEVAMIAVNLTPHSITLRAADGSDTVLPSAGLARVASTPGQQIASAPVALFSAPTWGEVSGLPSPVEGTIYVVSALVAGRCVGRADVFSPGTGPADGAIRGEDGQIVAVTRLIQAPQSSADGMLARFSVEVGGYSETVTATSPQAAADYVRKFANDCGYRGAVRCKELTPTGYVMRRVK